MLSNHESGIHQRSLNQACQSADLVIWYKAQDCKIDFQSLLVESKAPAYAFDEVDKIITYLEENSLSGDQIVIMSNGGFEGIHDKLLQTLQTDPSTLN